MGSILIAMPQIRAVVITEWVIAILTVAVGVMIAAGLVRAWLVRRHTQVVIQDVEPDDGVPAESAARLSLQLRQAVRAILRRQSDAARVAAMETLDEDIRSGLVTVHGSITMNTTGELDRTTQDSMSALLAGLRAVAPKEAGGLAAVLELAIPPQRGWSVRAFPAIREAGGSAQVGLSVEVARLGRAPDAVTTFWTTPGALQQPGTDAARVAAIGELLHQLVQPASVWIAIRLVSRDLTRKRRWYRGLLIIGRTRKRELAGLQAQLAGQLLLYAAKAQEKFVGGFAREALGNLEQAAHLLPQYYRPRLTQGAVHELQGYSYRQSGNVSGAQRAFTRAVDAYEAAKMLLLACDAGSGKADTAIERLALRQTKCRMLTCDREQADTAMKELCGYAELKDTRPVPLYNAACLFAVAMACPDLRDDQRALFEWHAWRYLGVALLCSHQDSGLWSRMMTENELSALGTGHRKTFGDELGKRHRRPLAYAEAAPIAEEIIADIGVMSASGRSATSR